MQKLMEFEDEKKQNEIVIEQLLQLEDTRKCWHLINGVLIEKVNNEVVPEIRTVINNLNGVIRQITNTLGAMKQEF